MFQDDLIFLCCPSTKEGLELVSVTALGEDGEILDGIVTNASHSRNYQVRNGVIQFDLPEGYNETWDYKWRVIDAGRGLNYQIIDKKNRAYEIHDLFDRNAHEDQSFRHARGRVAVDIGCGVGQYSMRLLGEHGPSKIIALDLTTGVETFRSIVHQQYPQFKKKIIFVRASVFDLPIKDESVDYVMSLGVLHHTGDTKRAIVNCSKILKPGGQLNFWVYSPLEVHLDVTEPNHRVDMTIFKAIPQIVYGLVVMLQIRIFRRLPHRIVVGVLKIFSSTAWYRIVHLPLIGRLARVIFPTVDHPDPAYRYLNNYDGWCNRWAETWSEQELFGTLRECSIVIRGLSPWRTGIWGEKSKSLLL